MANLLNPQPGIILVINGAKRRPKNYLTEDHIETIAGIYHGWGDPVVGSQLRCAPIAAIITKEEAARKGYNLSPGHYVATIGKEEVLPLEEAMVLLREAEEERAQADREHALVLNLLGFENAHLPNGFKMTEFGLSISEPNTEELL